MNTKLSTNALLAGMSVILIIVGVAQMVLGDANSSDTGFMLIIVGVCTAGVTSTKASRK